MTTIITPEMGNSGNIGGVPSYSTSNMAKLKKVSYDYAYPSNLDLRPGSETHNKILSEVITKAQQSYSVMSRRHEAWNKIDDTLCGYITTDVVENKVKLQDARKPVSVVVPYSFATLETIMTYFTSAFFQFPIFQYEGTGPEDVVGAKLLELVVAHQMRRSSGALALHTMFRDSLAYSGGYLVASWRREMGKRIVTKNKVGLLGSLFGKRKATIDTVFYEGADLINIDPYLALPDPNMPIQKVDRGEFFGWIDEVPLSTLLEMENWPNSGIFNCQYLAHTESASQFTIDPTRRGGKYGLNMRRKMYGATQSKTRVSMYVTLIPKEWKLGTSEIPEKWAFEIVDDSVVIKAQPLNLVHNRYPVVVASPDFDGYSIAPTSRIEMMDGLQEVINFLFNSHVANVRRSVNNMFVVDPSLINMPDFDDPTGGLLIRLRRAAWGRGVNDAITQLNVNDITGKNITDIYQVMDMGQRFTGATENAMGMMRRGSERRSATEASGAMQSVTNRMERMAGVISSGAMLPLAYLLAYHTQQLMTEDTFIKIAGEWVNELQSDVGYKRDQRVMVSPFDILVQFDVEPRDGSLPTDNGRRSETWIQLYQILANSEQLAPQFDMVKIFKHIARLMGAKNVSEFQAAQQQTQVQTMPDQEVADEVQKGNMVPVSTSGQGMQPPYIQ